MKSLTSSFLFGSSTTSACTMQTVAVWWQQTWWSWDALPVSGGCPSSRCTGTHRRRCWPSWDSWRHSRSTPVRSQKQRLRWGATTRQKNPHRAVWKPRVDCQKTNWADLHFGSWCIHLQENESKILAKSRCFNLYSYDSDYFNYATMSGEAESLFLNHIWKIIVGIWINIQMSVLGFLQRTSC